MHICWQIYCEHPHPLWSPLNIRNLANNNLTSQAISAPLYRWGHWDQVDAVTCPRPHSEMWNLDVHTLKLTWFQSCVLRLTSDYSCPPRGRALNDEWGINSEFKVLTFKRADEMALLVIKYVKEWWWCSPGLFWREQYLFGLNALYTCVCVWPCEQLYVYVCVLTFVHEHVCVLCMCVHK